MFKNSPSICYIFFAIDYVIVMSIKTYASVMGINTEDKYLVRFLRENKKYLAKRLLKMFPNKNWSLGGQKALIKELTTQVLLFDVLGSGRPHTVRTVPVLSVVLIRAFSPPRLQFLLGNILSNRFASYFFFSQRFYQVLIFSAEQREFVNKLRRANKYEPFLTKTERFRNSCIPYCVSKFR